MTDLHHILKPDYDKRVGRGEQSFFCYSAKKMRRLYPEKNFTVVGEVKKGKTLDNRETPKKSKKEERRIGQFSLNGKPLGMFPVGEHNRFTHSRVGYVCVGDNTFVAMHASRIPFLILFPTLLASIALLVFLIIRLAGAPDLPAAVIDPDHPLPSVDPDIQVIPGDGDDKTPSEGGGGFVSMVYTKAAEISLGTGKAEIYWQNPGKSNHSVLLELYIVSDGTEYFLGRTGLIPAGSAIYTLDVSGRDVTIRAGIYTGLYRAYYYDPLTGERAVVSSDITEVTVTVTE